MAIMKFCQHALFCMSLFVLSVSYAENPYGQTFQINTHFSAISGKPTWLLIVRDMQTGQVLPYLYDIRNNDNFWVAFTVGRSYQVKTSSLKFGPYAKIKNFCHLEDGVISGQSYWITLTGELSPNTNKFKCKVTKYKDMPFTVVSPNHS